MKGTSTMAAHWNDLGNRFRRGFFALLCALALLFSPVMSPTAAAESPSPAVELLASGPDGLTVEIAVNEPGRLALSAAAGDLQLFSLDGYIPGADGLPTRDLLLALPPSGDAHLTIEPLTEPRLLEGSPPVTYVPRAPEEQGATDMTTQPTWEPVLLPDEPATPPLATLTEEGFFRQWRIARLRLTPLAYMGHNQWQLTPSFRVSVSFDEPAPTGQAPSDDTFASLVTQTLLNG